MRDRAERDTRHGTRRAAALIGLATTLALASALPQSALGASIDGEAHLENESQPVPPDIDPTRPMTEEELAELTAYNQEMYPGYYGHPEMDPQFAAVFWPGDLMWFVGKTALQFGLQKGFGAGLEKLFPGRPDPTAEALEQIADQLDGLRDQIRGVSAQVSALGDQLDELKQLHEWNVYFDRERDVETHKANVHLYADLVAGYERHEQWDEYKARAVASVNVEALAQIEVKLVAGTDPAFQNLQKVLRYSPADTRWAQIDAYRRSYEAVLATAVMNIMAAHDKYPGLFQAELGAAVQRYDRTVDALYETAGLAYPQPMQFRIDGPAVPAGAQLHALGASSIVASPDRPLRRGETKRTLSTFDEIKSRYEALMDDYYRGKGPNDTSFGGYMRSLGFSSTVVVGESVRVINNGDWRVVWEAVVIQPRKIGKSVGTGTYATKAEAESHASSLRAMASATAPYELAVETNPAGHAISTDVDALELALEGVPITWDPEDAGQGGEMGPLLLDHTVYDTAVFVDAVTGQQLGIFDVSKGPIADAHVDPPPSGSLALILGESLTDASLDDGHAVPIGSTLITLPVAHEGHELRFRPLRRALERLNIIVEDYGSRDGGVFVDGSLACGRHLGPRCTLHLDPYAGLLHAEAAGGPYMVQRSWSGACEGGPWNTCQIDPGKGEQTLTATFEYFYPN